MSGRRRRAAIVMFVLAAVTLAACGPASSGGLFGGIGFGVIGLVLLFLTGGGQGCNDGGCFGPCLDVGPCLSYVPQEFDQGTDAGPGDAGRDGGVDSGASDTGDVGTLGRRDLLDKYRDRLPADLQERLDREA